MRSSNLQIPLPGLGSEVFVQSPNGPESIVPHCSSTPPIPIFSLGYQQRTIQELIQELVAAEISVLIDVRETPWSRRPDYAKGRLSASLRTAGIDYVHARFAGNPKELRRSARSHQECLDLYEEYVRSNPEVLQQLDHLIRERAAAGQSVCLFCYERHPADCHRSILLEGLEQLSGIRPIAVHLATEGAPRLTG